MDNRRFMYYQALADLRRAFEHASTTIIVAAEAARHLPPGEDDPIAIETMTACSRSILEALGKAPGMMQIFTGGRPFADASFSSLRGE